MKKGFVQLFPVIILALAVTIGAVTAAAVKRTADLKKGAVLSSSDSGKEENKDSDSSQKVENKTSTTTTKTETKENKEKVEIKAENEKLKLESKIENGKEETKLKLGNLRIETKKEDGKLVTKIKNEKDEDVEATKDVEEKLHDLAEMSLEEEDVEISTDSAKPTFTQKGTTVSTNFPLSVNPTTGQLTVTTPAGQKVVAVLPSEAIQGILDSAIGTTINQVELEEEGGTLVYKVKGAKTQKLFGFIPITTQIQTTVSAENGDLLKTDQSAFEKFVDLISI